MELFRRDDLERLVIPGRAQQRAVGRDCPAPSEKVSVGFARFSAEHGSMDPHCHDEEIVYVLDARGAWLEWGASSHDLTEWRELEPGTVVHIASGEWHAFRHAEDGFVDILFVFVPPVW